MFCFIQSVRFILFIFVGVLSLSPLLALSSDVRGKILDFLLFKKKKSVWIAFVFDVLSFLFFYSVFISSPQGRFGQITQQRMEIASSIAAQG